MSDEVRRSIILIFFLLCANITFAQSTQKAENDYTLRRIDSLIQVSTYLLQNIEINQSLKQRFKLYPTENIYTFLQLDTKTGKIDQVQWSLDRDQEGSIPINDTDLSYGYGSGVFELYPTQNMYQFILLDKTDGRKWHVQWGIGSEKRWIRPM